MPKVCAAIWDVDGTLVDTAEMHFAAWVRLTAEIRKPFTRADFAATFGRRNPEIIRELFDAMASDSTVAEIGERKEQYYRHSLLERGVELLPGVHSLLEQFHSAGWKQAIASSAPRANLDLILDSTHTREFFPVVVAMEDTTRGKPDPQVFEIAAERLGVPPNRCIVFEDAVAGVQAAKAAGMACVAVTFVGHHSEERLRVAGADRIVNSLKELTIDQLLPLMDSRV